MSKKARILLCAAAALLALAVALYPPVSNYLGEKNRSLVQTQYAEAVQKMDNSQILQARKAAQDYNDTLLNVTTAPYSKESLEKAAESYDTLLDVSGTGIMGTVEIPSIRVTVPIYHGTGNSALERGAGHLLGSSLPVGGTGTHCVITGHSGLAGQRLFSDLEQLKKGDLFYLHVLDSDLAYEVREISTVLPEDTSRLTVDPSRDICTLITCTPYGVNSHRLLVRGERTELPPPAEESDGQTAEQEPEPIESVWTEQYLHGVGYGILAVAGLFAAVRTAQMARELKDPPPFEPHFNVSQGETHFRQRRRKAGKHEPK